MKKQLITKTFVIGYCQKQTIPAALLNEIENFFEQFDAETGENPCTLTATYFQPEVKNTLSQEAQAYLSPFFEEAKERNIQELCLING